MKPPPPLPPVIRPPLKSLFTLQHVSTPQQLQALARDVAIRDTRRQSDRLLPRVSDVEKAVFVADDGTEPPEWWSAFESGYT